VVTKAGAKLLDFGLAKLRALEAETGAALSSLHTATAAKPLTSVGTIMGTFQYMAPEQVEGGEADARTDVWALGAVLYEMATGRKAFAGKNQASLMAAILKEEPPPMRELTPVTPPALDRLVRTCLAKDPDERMQSARDVARELGWMREAGSEASAGRRPRVSRVLAILAALVLALLAGLWAGRRSGPKGASARAKPIHLTIAAAPGVSFVHSGGNPGVAISPDGSQLVYVGRSAGERLYRQDLDQGTVVAIPDTEGASNPVFSPDGKAVAFKAGGKLQTVSLAGGQPVPLADGWELGAWSPDGETLYFVPDGNSGIWKVPARGGNPTPITKPDRDGFDNTHWWPEVLPGGDRLLYTSCCGRNRIMAVDLPTGKRTSLIENGFFARYVATGHLVFAQGSSLVAARFDPVTLEVGSPVKVLPNVVIGHEQFAEYSISQNGSLLYFSGESDFAKRLVRISRNGADRQILTEARPYSYAINLTRNGERVAVSFWEGQLDVFVYDLVRGGFDRITLDPHNDWSPVWTPDDRKLVFTSVRRGGQFNFYIQPADKSAPAELLYASKDPQWPSSWSPDGKLLAFGQYRAGQGGDIWIYSTESRRAGPFRDQPFDEGFARFSPDGRWLAYQSDELGQSEVYVAPYPGPGPTCKVSTVGGGEPHWSGDGKELFYRHGTTAMVADVANRNFCNAQSRTLFDGLAPGSWDVSSKGDFFVTFQPHDPPRLHLVLNWSEELKRLVPAN